jgi:hypothetical protein
MSKFTEIKQLRRMLDSSILRMPGIMAVATGYKKVKNKKTDELSVIIYVAKKLPLSRIPYFHAIPSALKIRDLEVTTDIVEVGYYTPISYDSYERPALGGVSIGHTAVTAGTLGGLVCGLACEEQKDSVLILSNNHVLAAINKGEKGDHIVQPGTYDGGVCHENCIAELERFVPIDFAEGAVNYVDCAVAKPYNSADLSFKIHDIGIPHLSETYSLTETDVLNSLHVQKTGRTTEYTKGYVSAIDWKGSVLYDWTPAYFEQQIVVETLSPGTPVALGGDSGSLVLTMDNKICGLLFAGPTSGDHYIANHIHEVFNRLNVKLCCAPTESVRGTDKTNMLHELRQIRDRIRVDKKLKKYLDLYGKHAGEFFQEFLRNPKLKAKASEITVAASELVHYSDVKLDDKVIKLCNEVIDAVSKESKNKEFIKDMHEVKELLAKAKGETMQEILEMLKKMKK